MNDTAAPKIDPMTEMVTLHVPKASGEDRMLFIGLNGKAWNIPRGTTVEVPKPVADIYYQSVQNAEAADRYAEAKQQEMTKVYGAPV